MGNNPRGRIQRSKISSPIAADLLMVRLYRKPLGFSPKHASNHHSDYPTYSTTSKIFACDAGQKQGSKSCDYDAIQMVFPYRELLEQ